MRRLFGLARPYRGALWCRSCSRSARRARLAIPWLTGRVIDHAIRRGHAAADDADRADARRGRGALRADVVRRLVAGTHGRDDRVRPAQPPLRPPADAVVLVLRPQPDRAADEPRDGRPQRRAGVPVLRPAVPLAAHHHGARRDGPAGGHRSPAGARRARDHPAARRRRDALLPRLAPRADGRAAAPRGRHDAGRGERGRRARGQGVRPGGPRDRALPRALRARLRRERQGHAPAGRVPAAPGVPADAGGGRRALRWAAVVSGRITLGDFVTFSLLLGMLVFPLRMLGMWIGQAQRAVASGARIFAILDERARGRRRAAGPRAAGGRRRDPLRGRRVRLRRRAHRAARHRPGRAGRHDGRADRPDGLRQDDAGRARAALLRRHRRARAGRRRRRARPAAGRPAARGRRRLRGHVPVQRLDPREHRLRRAERDRRARSARPPSGRRRCRSSRRCRPASTRWSASAA